MFYISRKDFIIISNHYVGGNGVIGVGVYGKFHQIEHQNGRSQSVKSITGSGIS